ncbi:hypothetical protein [Nocardioides caricicola]|uniref:Uncharacterized protein n=1 Tax=Nocardioides caricicola TaxID=634770 RepID=A0ABW0MXX8_9ACTN
MSSELTAPDGWEVVTEPAVGTRLVAAEPEHGGFRANLVVTSVACGGLSFSEWQAGTDVVLGRTLDRYLVIDLERVAVAGHPGGRRLAHHVGPTGEALTMEQWFTAVDDVGHTLTATVPTSRYLDLSDTMGRAAASWRPS